MIKSLQLSRQSGEEVEEWMGRLRIADVESNYKELDR